MEFSDNPYYKYVRILLSLIGQWPYDKGNLKYLPRFVITILIVSFTLVEVFKIITSWGQLEVVVQMIPFFFFPVGCGLKYYTYWIQNTGMRTILENIKLDWNMLQSKKEIEILKTYTAEGWFYGKIYAAFLFSVTAAFVLLLFVPFILDIVIPVNASRAEMLPFEAEYFIDMQGRYFYVILHVQTTAVAGVASIAATDVFYILLIFHVCGLYGIIRYRLEHEFDGMHTICNARKVLVIRIRMRRAVLLHLRCIEILEYGKSIFALSYLIQLIVIVIVLAGMLYNVYLLLVSGENMLAVAFILDLVGHYILLYMNILPGQRLIEDSSELYSATYNGRWYEAPLKAQKLVMFLLMQTRKPYVLTASGLVDMSVETLSMIVRISFSYFMLIRSTQG